MVLLSNFKTKFLKIKYTNLKHFLMDQGIFLKGIHEYLYIR